MNDGRDCFSGFLVIATPFVVSFVITITLNLQCSFLGISQMLWSFCNCYDCAGFFLRDWISIWVWVIGTIWMVSKLTEKNEDILTVLGKWICFVVIGGALLEIGAVMSIVVLILFIWVASCWTLANDYMVGEETNPETINPSISNSLPLKEIKITPDALPTLNYGEFINQHNPA